ncbi:hypothetical protein E8D34_09725 [Nocardioides sp. GY 10113]|uniref:hypothetical protein n=1 Tax=Nocardioides sp. GY 10113 TaxID=2569761 RepID=UPI0010A8A9AA|nr:hypothetical protein [Nocardioides sp. GY 10113]TIC87401.1 hypothetical protein E8D34_09725 [Nocardioides sp. GY 10113]
MSAADRTVYIHVGTPKSGTTYLQRALSKNRRLLRRNGYLYPGRNPGHFVEAMGLIGRGFRGYLQPGAREAWEKLVADVNAHDGPALISHETLAPAGVRTIRRAVEAFVDREVRVVVTCRDLGRQLPAVWQEGVKNGDTGRYEEFLGHALDAWDGVDASSRLWSSQNVASIAQRWGSVVGPDRVALVTVPAPGGDPDGLWNRFAAAVDLPELAYAQPSTPGNPSLGTVETEFLRRFNLGLPDQLAWPDRARLVKRRFAQRQLVRYSSGGALGVPDVHHEPIRRIAGEMVEEIRRRGYAVHGDIDDLTPAFRPGGTFPDEVTDAQLLELAIELLVPMVLGGATARPEGSAAAQGSGATGGSGADRGTGGRPARASRQRSLLSRLRSRVGG